MHLRGALSVWIHYDAKPAELRPWCRSFRTAEFQKLKVCSELVEVCERCNYLQQTVDTSDRKLQSCPGTPGDRLLLVTGLALVSHGAFGTLARKPFCSFTRHGSSLRLRTVDVAANLILTSEGQRCKMVFQGLLLTHPGLGLHPKFTRGICGLVDIIHSARDIWPVSARL